MTENNKVLIKAPGDRSTKAYKEWILAIRFAITGKKSDGSSISEEQWDKLAAEFWEGQK